MATVKAIKYGMKGDEVSNLQTSLKNAGYNIDVDGSFGPQTLAAVKQYQQKNGLDVDGMVGPQTQAALFGGNTTKPAASTPASTTPTTGKASNKAAGETSGKNEGSGSAAASGNKNTGFTYDPYQSSGAVNNAVGDGFSYDDFSYADYAESETVLQAQAALNAILAAQPGAYESKWQGQIDEMIGRILNREKFTYDINSDALYQQYADQYKNLGKLAMQDTMGQAAAMTGGYGNSYAQSVGQQAYQGYLSQLNEMVPELYGMALDQYNREGQEMYNQYGLLSDQEAQDYGRYRDAYNDWLAERDYATGRYDSERNFDYGKYVDDRNFGYQLHTDKQNWTWNEYVTAIQKAQWEKEYEAGEEQREIDNAYRDKVFASGEKQRNFTNALDIISAGGTLTDEELNAAGISKSTYEAMTAMAAVESGNEEEAYKHVKSMSYPEMETALTDYIDAGKLDEAKGFVDYLWDAGLIQDDAWYTRWLNKIILGNGHTTTDTTVAPLGGPTGSGGHSSGGQAVIKN